MDGEGIDFLLPKRVDRRELSEVLADALEVRSVEVVGEVEEVIGDQEGLAIVHEVRGEFRTLVQLVRRGDLETVKRVARGLGTHVLAPDDSTDNPYGMLLIRYDRSAEKVVLAAEGDEYRLL
jgi:hypothetical protein